MNDERHGARGVTVPLGSVAVEPTLPTTTDRMPNNPHLPATTLPIAKKASDRPAPVMNHRATQMSASAVPSTLESPQESPPPGAAENGARPHVGPDEISGMALAPDLTVRDDESRAAALREIARRDGAAPPVAATEPSARPFAGAPTMMSPLVPDKTKAADPSVPPPPAVTIAQAPAHAYLPAPKAQPAQPTAAHGLAGSPYAQPRGGQHAHGSPAKTARRSSNTLLIALVAGALILVLMVVAVSVGVFAVFRSRRAPTVETDDRGTRGSRGADPPPVEEAPAPSAFAPAPAVTVVPLLQTAAPKPAPPLAAPKATGPSNRPKLQDSR